MVDTEWNWVDLITQPSPFILQNPDDFIYFRRDINKLP